MDDKTDYEQETETLYGECCGAYCSEAGCCPFITKNQKQTHEKNNSTKN